MKITRMLALTALMGIAFSCSKDDDAKPANQSLADASLSFSSQTTVVSPPAGISSSQDPYAQQVSGYVTSVNAVSNYLSYFKPPSNATKSSAQITASNGRQASTQTEYLVYIWTAPNTDITVAYQVSEVSDKYVFEIFFKNKSDNSWLRYVYAEEKKDRSSGLMKIYNIWTADAASDVLITYTWTRSGDMLDFVMTEGDGDYSIVITISINVKTKAGSVLYVVDGKKLYGMEWDAKGSGSWTWYEDDGVTVSDSGTWTV